MKSDLKKYEISQTAIDSIPIKKEIDSDFKKHKKHSKSSTWIFIENDTNTLKYLTQINLRNDFYGGFLPEPYILFLKNSKSLNDSSIAIEKTFKNNIDSILPFNENFKIKILRQETYNEFITSKISSLISLIMSVESFLNNLIPENIVINENGEEFRKKEIEEKFSLKQKFNQVVRKIKIIENLNDYQNEYSRIIQLNQIRNDFIHLKTKTDKKNMDPFLKQFEKLITLNLSKEIQNVEKLFEDIIKMKNVC